MTPQEIMDQAASVIQAQPEKWVNRVKGIIGIVVSGNNGGSWLINLKDAPGVTKGDINTAEMVAYLKEQVMLELYDMKYQMIAGLRNGKIKIKGSMELAMRLLPLFLASKN